MRRHLTLAVLFIIIEGGFVLSPLAAQESQSLKIESLSWLAGTWESADDRGDTEEHWMSPKAGLMLGINRTISRKGNASFEFLRIAEASTEGAKPGIVYYASPDGQPPVPFELITSGEQTAVFQNLGNDFPQRIIYKRENDKLTARIEGRSDGRDQSIEWHWHLTPDPTR